MDVRSFIHWTHRQRRSLSKPNTESNESNRIWHTHFPLLANGVGYRWLVKPPELGSQILHAIASLALFEGLAPAPTDAEIQFAFRSAPMIRHPFTLGDLFLFLNWDQETLSTQISKIL